MDEFGSITIGGNLPEEKVEELKQAFVGDCYNCREEEFEDLSSFCRDGWLQVHQNVPDGEFSNVEEFCKTHGLMFKRKSSATDDYDAVLCVSFPAGTPKNIFPTDVFWNENCPIWEYHVDREDNVLQGVQELQWLKQALIGVTLKNAPTWVNHEVQLVRDYAKALLAGKGFEFVTNKIIEEVVPMYPSLPPFKIIESKSLATMMKAIKQTQTKKRK